MLIQNTTQFQQDTQRNLQATQSTLQAIDKLEMQMGQLATSLSEREKGKFPSQPIANPRGQSDIGASSHHEQAKAITTLRSGKTIDNHVDDPPSIEI